MQIDILELNKPTPFSLGESLRVGKYTYGDLDELITAHIRVMAGKVELMLASDKFKGTEEETSRFTRLLSPES